MGIEQTLLQEIQESQKALDGPIDDTIYRRDHSKRIELINWVLENMKNPNVQICEVMESRLSEIILKVNQSKDIFKSDKLHSEIQILDYLFYQVCKDQQKNW